MNTSKFNLVIAALVLLPLWSGFADTLQVDGNLEVTGSGLFEGTYTGTSGAIPAEGAGARMMWYPEKAAFRAGHVTGTSWDDSNIGIYSAAFGSSKASGSKSFAAGSAQATGDYSFAAGTSQASGFGSFAAGIASDASGSNSLAVGEWNDASGMYAVAFGVCSYATAYGSFASGEASNAYGNNSVALGGDVVASGDYSVAMGDGSYAFGRSSFAVGSSSMANGNVSIALGASTRAYSYACMAVGHYNEGRWTSGVAWQDDHLNSVFEVGIGPTYNDRKNGLTVLQDGSVEVGRATDDDDSVPLHIKADGSVLLARAQGDIPMFGQ